MGENLTEEEKEQRLMESASELMEKSASADAPQVSEFIADEEGRLEDRQPAPEESPDEDESAPATTSQGKWTDRPSVRNQIIEHPDTVRFADPETKVLNLSKPDELKEYNRIQKAAADEEAPQLAVQDCERQFYDGSWIVFLTYSQVQYLSL